MGELFSVEGRSTRTQFWVSQLLFVIPYAMIMIGTENYDTALSTVGFIIGAIMFLPVLFISIKRWHDLNKSGIYVLINLIPYIGSFITTVWQGFIGPNNTLEDSNEYGDDPRIKEE